MDRKQPTATDLVNLWNNAFPNHKITSQNVSKPEFVMGALMEVLDKIGLNCNAVMAPPPEHERDVHMEYYGDLLPVLNLVRMVNHVLSVIQNPTFNICLEHLLAPTAGTTQSLLLLLYNINAFYAGRMQAIEPREIQLFKQTELVQELETDKIKLAEAVNKQSIDKASRAARLEKVENEIARLLLEIQSEEDTLKQASHEKDAVLQEVNQIELELDQKRAQRDALLAQVAQVRALRVTDADDIRAQYKQAVRNEKEAIEDLDSLKEKLLVKKNNIQKLRHVKGKIDEAIVTVHDITKITDSLKKLSSAEEREGEGAGLDGEVGAAAAALRDLDSQAAELRRERADLAAERAHRAALMTQLLADNTSDEAKLKSTVDLTSSLSVQLAQVKEGTEHSAARRDANSDQIKRFKEHYYSRLRTFADALVEEGKKAESVMEEKVSECGQGK